MSQADAADEALGDAPAKVKLCPVERGILVDNKVEITKGVIAGDEIVVKGQNLLNDGASVNIEPRVNDWCKLS